MFLCYTVCGRFEPILTEKAKTIAHDFFLKNGSEITPNFITFFSNTY